MSQDSDLEKTEEATPQRLEKAAEEGQVVRSRELVTWLMLCVGLAFLWATAGSLGAQFSQTLRSGLGFERGEAFNDAHMLEHAGLMLRQGLFALLPLLGLMWLAALVSPLLLGGWHFSAGYLAPQFSKLNPAAGLARLVSAQTGAELVKTLLKSLLIGGVGAWAIWARLPDLMALMGASVHGALAAALQLVGVICALMLGALVLVPLLDVPWQIFSHHRKLRMTREEVKREHRESEGDPHVKAQIRRQRQQMAKRRMMAELPKADIVVTNPTHFAVALKYVADGQGAPRVVAKGADLVALRIKALAAEHRIPVLEAPPLTRALFRHTALGQEIPVALYTAVAEVLAWAYQLNRQFAEGGQAPKEPSDFPVPASLDFVPGVAGAAA